jgi:hypothetical protein
MNEHFKQADRIAKVIPWCLTKQSKRKFLHEFFEQLKLGLKG